MPVKIILRSVLIVLVFGYSYVVFGQNLIANPSFESYVNCPVTLGNLEKDINIWKSPTLGSTDYFNGCSEAMGTPKNFNGEQMADFGVGYIGFYMYAPDDYREYLMAKLNTTLVKGEKYTVSFYVSLAERSDFAVKEFGIRFSEFPVKVETRKVLSAMHWSKQKGDHSNYFNIEYAKFYSDEKDWILLSQKFVANGTENYMVIGNFKDNRRTQRFQTKRKITKGAYYYLDMVSVRKSSEDNNNDYLDYELETIHVFKNVLFNFNKASLQKEDQKELLNVLRYMVKNSSVSIKISGHTDEIGTDKFNQKLSKKRAKTVADFLIAHDIDKSRITYDGYGSKKPVATNKTNAGRLLNRRVEFVLIE